MASSFKNTKLQGSIVNLPKGTTAQRPGSPAAGMLRFNTDLGKSEIYDGSQWQNYKPNYKNNAYSTSSLGRDVISEKDDYKVHNFVSGHHNWRATQDGIVEILVVAGGGSGGEDSGTTVGNGGGGAGGVLYRNEYTVSADTDYSVVVGTGGAGTYSPTNNNGNDSIFGVNLVTNGHFDSNVSGWISSLGLEWSKGRLRANNTSGSNIPIYQVISGLEVGAQYTFSYEHVQGYTAAYINNSANSSGPVLAVGDASGTNKVRYGKFTANATSMYVVIYAIQSTDTIFDNVSVTKVEDSLVAIGGGSGGWYNNDNGETGGSGGGGGATAGVGQIGTSGQGNSGANGSSSGGGGGGGAGSSASGGNGGAGLPFDISGETRYYGGGGGGSRNTGQQGRGGSGGGGDAAVGSGNARGLSGTKNAGGGGGAQRAGGLRSGDGGDGVVIIRYKRQGPRPIIHVFDEPGTTVWMPPIGSTNAEVLVVAGGGGGGMSGARGAGGGGAGGVIHIPSYAINSEELVTNGTFDTDASSWNILDAGSDTQSVSNGQLTINRGPSGGNFVTQQVLSVVPNQKYIVSVDIISYTEAWSIEIAEQPSNNDLVDTRDRTELGTQTFEVTPTVDQMSITLGAGSSANSGVVMDNVSCRAAYTVIVGDGGAGSTSYANKGTSGENSQFGNVIANGGGGGGSEQTGSGSNGGSGGGAGGVGDSQGTGTNNEGFDGGDGGGGGDANESGGGGGGAGEPGQAGATGISGNGGDGSAYGTSGVCRWYGGGGGGAGGDSSYKDNYGEGGAGGGGNGQGWDTSASSQSDSFHCDGEDGTGGGGGGHASNGRGGKGGSGTVIIKYFG